MARTTLSWCLALLLAVVPAVAQVPGDPDVLKGVKQAEEGDYDAAILTLDNAARRLSSDPSKTRELSYAYLYLGIAYVGKGHEAAAKAKFREAVTRLTDLSLSPDKFSPKIIDLFEAVKEETARGGPKPGPAKAASSPPASTIATAAPPRTPPAAVKGSEGGGKGKTLLFVGLGVAAAGAAVLVLAGGGGEECLGAEGIRTGRLSAESPMAEFPVGRRSSGAMSAEISWRSEGSGPSDVQLLVLGPASNAVAHGERTTEASRRVTWAAGQDATRLRLQLQGTTPVLFNLSLPECP